MRGLIENPRDSFFACVRRGRRTGLAASQCLTCTGGILAGGLVCNRERGGSAPRFLLKSHHASKARVIISVCGQRGQRAQLAGQTGNAAIFFGTMRGGSGVSAAHVGPMGLRHRTSGSGAAGQTAWVVAARLPASYAPIARGHWHSRLRSRYNIQNMFLGGDSFSVGVYLDLRGPDRGGFRPPPLSRASPRHTTPQRLRV